MPNELRNLLAFFGWLGVVALVCWRTAFQMPDGYGNALFGLQFIGAVISTPFVTMGLPTATGTAHPELDACLATVGPRELATCTVWFRTTARRDHADVTVDRAQCTSAPIARCVQATLSGSVTIKSRQLASLRYAGTTTIRVPKLAFRGSSSPPPAEHE